MLSQLNKARKEKFLDSVYNFLCDAASTHPRSRISFKKYNKCLLVFRDKLDVFVRSGELKKDNAKFIFIAFVIIRRNEVLRSNVRRCNVEFALGLVGKISRTSRLEVHKLNFLMTVHPRIKVVVSPSNAFQILKSLHDSGAASVYSGFLKSMKSHLELLSLTIDIHLN